MVIGRSLVKAHLLFIGGEQLAGCWAVSLKKVCARPLIYDCPYGPDDGGEDSILFCNYL